jgi:CheY-like chemotaxis protein
MHPPATQGPHVRLTVSDTGAGMDRVVVARAFEPFFTTKPKGEGTGLGLATVYGIVTDAGGNIHIYSEPGMGTTVQVHWPATAADPASDTRQSPRATRGETVLIVEDEANVRRVARRILVKAGYKVLTAPGGRDALEICEYGPERIQLLLTDVIMPEMLGPELATRATRLRPDMAVLFMSGYTDQVIETETPDGDEVPFVQKPFTAATLLAGVDGVLSRPAS